MIADIQDYPHGIRSLRIRYEDGNYGADVVNQLVAAGFDTNRPICLTPDPDTFSKTYYQGRTLHDLLFKKFTSNWEPEWKRRKRILMRRYEK